MKAADTAEAEVRKQRSALITGGAILATIVGLIGSFLAGPDHAVAPVARPAYCKGGQGPIPLPECGGTIRGEEYRGVNYYNAKAELENMSKRVNVINEKLARAGLKQDDFIQRRDGESFANFLRRGEDSIDDFIRRGGKR